jgi:hypothetical protein
VLLRIEPPRRAEEAQSYCEMHPDMFESRCD